MSISSANLRPQRENSVVSYTPPNVVIVLVEMLEPYSGRIYEIILQRLIQFNGSQISLPLPA